MSHQPDRSNKRYPMLRYPWVDTRAVLVALANRLADQPSFLFTADETPLHRKLGVHEVGCPSRLFASRKRSDQGQRQRSLCGRHHKLSPLAN